jgi:hypothetical protein
MCRLSWYLGASTSWNPQRLSRPVTGSLLILLYIKAKLWNTAGLQLKENLVQALYSYTQVIVIALLPKIHNICHTYCYSLCLCRFICSIHKQVMRLFLCLRMYEYKGRYVYNMPTCQSIPMGTGVSFPVSKAAETREFSPPQNIHSGSGVDPASYLTSTGDFPRGKADGECSWPHICSTAGFKKEWVHNSAIRPSAFMACTRANLRFCVGLHVHGNVSQKRVFFAHYVTAVSHDESIQRLSDPGYCDGPHVPRQKIHSVSTSIGTQKARSSRKRTGNLWV